LVFLVFSHYIPTKCWMWGLLKVYSRIYIPHDPPMSSPIVKLPTTKIALFSEPSSMSTVPLRAKTFAPKDSLRRCNWTGLDWVCRQLGIPQNGSFYGENVDKS
jgi:hypothetical protein